MAPKEEAGSAQTDSWVDMGWTGSSKAAISVISGQDNSSYAVSVCSHDRTRIQGQPFWLRQDRQIVDV